MTYAIKYFPHTQHFDKYDPSKMDYFTKEHSWPKQQKKKKKTYPF